VLTFVIVSVEQRRFRCSLRDRKRLDEKAFPSLLSHVCAMFPASHSSPGNANTRSSREMSESGKKFPLLSMKAFPFYRSSVPIYAPVKIRTLRCPLVSGSLLDARIGGFLLRPYLSTAIQILSPPFSLLWISFGVLLAVHPFLLLNLLCSQVCAVPCLPPP